MTSLSASLPVRKVLIVLGQSNSTAIAPAKTFEDQNYRIALRNPKVEARARYYHEGTTRDEIVLPDSEFGDFQTLNYRDKGALSVRYLTFFNPISTCYDKSDAANPIAVPTYPGTLQVTEVVNANTFKTELVWQADPVHTQGSGGSQTTHSHVPLTRLRTGQVYTMKTDPSPGSEVEVTQSFDPPLVVGERFSYPLTESESQVAGNHDTLALYNQFGGFHDPGGVIEAATSTMRAPSTTVGGFSVSVWDADLRTDNVVTCTEHALHVGRRFQFVEANTNLNPDSNNAPRGSYMPGGYSGGTSTPTVDFGVDYYIVRIDDDDPTKAHFSDAPDGEPIAFTAPSGNEPEAEDIRIAFLPDGRDSTLEGMQVRCLTGANAGEVRPLGKVVYVPAENNNPARWDCKVAEDFTNHVGQNDTFEFTPPDAPDGTAVPFDKWAYFLPVCQFFGREQGLQAQLPVKVLNGALVNQAYSGSAWGIPADPDTGAFINTVYVGCPVRFYQRVWNDFGATGSSTGPSSPNFSTELTVGQTYYVVSVGVGGSFQISDTYDGPPKTLSETDEFYMDWAETFLQKDNPAPPGFNYSNQENTPEPFQPYRGGSHATTPLEGQPTIAYHWGLAQRLAERIGESVYVIDFSVGLSSLAESVVLRQDRPEGYGWHDPGSMQHWGAGPASLRARWLRHLDAAEIAAAREGVKLEVIGVVFAQGESDADSMALAERYYTNIDGFKSFVRETLKDRGWWAKEVHEIPFLQPKLSTKTPVNADEIKTVNAAIVQAADEDPFSKTWSTDSYVQFDQIHYDGAGMDKLAQTAFTYMDGYMNALDIPLRICQLALALAGERSGITSVYPSDGSVEADLCAQFYPEARDRIFEAHAWDFLVREAALVETTNEREDWKYAFQVPRAASGVLGLGEDIMSAFDNKAVKIKFSIELNSASERVLYANQPAPLTVRYKARTADPRHFSTTCIQAIAHMVASMIVRTTMKGEEGVKVGEALEQRAMQTFKQAASIDANQTRDSSQSQTLGWRRR